jgi:hypothetical protein
MPTVRNIAEEAAKTDYRFDTLVKGIVESQAFQMRVKGAGQAEVAQQ